MFEQSDDFIGMIEVGLIRTDNEASKISSGALIIATLIYAVTLRFNSKNINHFNIEIHQKLKISQAIDRFYFFAGLRKILLFLIFFSLCIDGKSQSSNDINFEFGTSKENRLANKYCSTCHQFPEPALLDKKTWKNTVLPNMALRLGLKKGVQPDYIENDTIEAAIVERLNIYPDDPLISEKEWNKIVDYYLQEAPEKMPAQKKYSEIVDDDFPFDVQSVSIDNVKLPQVTLLKYDKQNSELYIGDYLNLYSLKTSGELANTWKLNSPASDIQFTADSAPILLTIGKLTPSDQKSGRMYSLGGANEVVFGLKNFPKLKRPVSFEIEDLNQDGTKDVVICNFGHHVGKLSWYEDFDASKEHILSTLPGARKVEIRDFDKDGKPDIIALMAQANEQITIFYNKGAGKFQEERLLEFSPVHGLSYFELADFNSDGYMDLLVTNGDNKDFSSIDKPYHGVRIYLNDQNNRFKEAFFFPMYDCNKAIARDFDNDGDLDIVASALYTAYGNLKKGENAIVYLNNDGLLKFRPSFPENTVHGNWLTMETADFNNDGFLDIILGAFIYDITEMANISSATGLTSFPQVLLLTKKK